MTKEEIQTYVDLGSGHTVCVDIGLAREFPGYVRKVCIHPQNRVSIEFDVYGHDEGGAYFWADYDSLDDLVKDLEAYLGLPLEQWENVEKTGRYPIYPESADLLQGHESLKRAIASGTIALPSNASYVLKSSYWKQFQAIE